MEGGSLFRASKRRRVVRQHNSSDEGSVATTTRPIPDDTVEGAFDVNVTAKAQQSLTSILRMRKQNKIRGTGVNFSKTKSDDAASESASAALVVSDPAAERLKSISDRFVGHSAQVVDVDKHMMAYIDAEMAKRRTESAMSPPKKVQRSRKSASLDSEYASSNEDEQSHDATASATTSTSTTRNPASLGLLHEIDLGPLAHQRAMNLTSLALERQSNPNQAPEEHKPRKARKPRLGRDGKPMKPRPRKRRPSADLARDALVEQVLQENRLDLYEGPERAPRVVGAADINANAEGDDADERLAEQFRQDFMDAMAQRRVQQQQRAKPGPSKAAGDQGQKGPKLGGSRSARAAMAMREREALQKKP